MEKKLSSFDKHKTIHNKVSSTALDQIEELMNDIQDKRPMINADVTRVTNVVEQNDIIQSSINSSMLTVKDADLAEESAKYLKSKILHETISALMTVANQSQSVALVLMNRKYNSDSNLTANLVGGINIPVLSKNVSANLLN